MRSLQVCSRHAAIVQCGYVSVCMCVQNDTRRAAREAVAGMRMGGLILEPQDVEVLTKVRMDAFPVARVPTCLLVYAHH